MVYNIMWELHSVNKDWNCNQRVSKMKQTLTKLHNYHTTRNTTAIIVILDKDSISFKYERLKFCSSGNSHVISTI